MPNENLVLVFSKEFFHWQLADIGYPLVPLALRPYFSISLPFATTIEIYQKSTYE